MDPLKSSHPCGQCAFYSDSVWQPISGSSVKLLSRGFKRRELSQGETLFHQGEENQGVFCVSRGMLALRMVQEDGVSTLLRLAYPGDVLGFRSFLRTGQHQTEAVAVMPSRVCTVAQRDVTHLMKTNPGVLARLAERCVEEIDKSHSQIVAMATKSNKDRLEDLLMDLLERHGAQRGAHMHMRLPLSRKDLSELIGVPQETLSRLIGRLQKDGRITISGREVLVPVSGAREYSQKQSALPH